MRKTNKFLWLPLAILLTLVVAIGTKVYLDRKTALEYLVTTFTDYRLAINGPFLFRLKDDQLVINLTNIVLHNKHDEAALLTAKRLDLKADIEGLSIASMKVRELMLSGAVATVIHHEDGSYNWPISSTQDASASTDWNSLLNKVSVKNTQILLTGFSEQSLQLDLKKLELFDSGDKRQLTLDAQLNQHPLTFSASVENISGLLLRHEPVKFSATGSIDGLDIKAKGTAGDSRDQTDLQVSIEGKNLSSLTALISTEIPELGQLSASARVLEVEGDYQLKDLQLSLDSPAFKLNVNGDASHTDDGFGLELELTLSSDDISQISSREELAQWQGLKVNLDTHLSYQPGRALLTNVKFMGGDKKQQLGLTVKTLQLQHNEQAITDIQASQADITYDLFDDKTDGQPWRYQYQADTVAVHIKPNNDVQIKTLGRYKTLPVSVDGLWQANGDYRFDVGLDKAKATVQGYLRDSVFNITGKLTTPSLKPLATLLNEDEVPIDRGELSIGILVKGDIIELSQLDFLLYNADSVLHVKGSARNLSDLDGLSFDVNVAARQLAHVNQWLSNSAVAVDRSLAALAEPESYASQGDVSYRRLMPIGSAWLDPLMRQLALKGWLDDYPALNGNTQIDLTMRGAGDTVQVHITQVDVKSDLASIQWTGHIKNRPNNFELIGKLHADLKQTAIDEIATAAVITTTTSMSGDGPLKLDKLHIIADQTELNGALALAIDDKLQSITGHIDFKRLDILPYTPAPIIIERDEGANTSENKEPDKGADQPLFSTDEFPLTWLPDYDINVKLSAAELITPWFKAQSVKATLSQNKKNFSLESAEFLIKDAHVLGNFHLDHSSKVPAASLYIRSDNFDPDLVTLVRNYDLVQKGTASVLVDIQGRGNNEQQLAASLNGRMTIVTRDAVLNGTDVNDLAPAVLKEINRKVNPFYNKDKVEDTQLDCGIIHFDIIDGVMEADKSIVLVTPEIVFGAHGAIDLKADYLRMQIIPQTRKGLGLSISGTFAKMAVIDGPIQNPTVGFDKTGAALTGTRDVTGTVLLGPLYWIYLGQAQKFLASGKACERVIDKVAPEFTKPPEPKKK